jgi:hypothetical protein
MSSLMGRIIVFDIDVILVWELEDVLELKLVLDV